MLVPATKLVPVPFQAFELVELALSVLEPPFNVPFVKLIFPVKVCVKPDPKFSVPPMPLIVSGPPFMLPVKVAVPAVFVI